MPISPLLVYVTTPTQADALQIAREAVEAKLAACANIQGPGTSLFAWDGALQQEEEWILRLKATTSTYDALEALIITHHPYDVPCVVAMPIHVGYTPFIQWLREQTQP